MQMIRVPKAEIGGHSIEEVATTGSMAEYYFVITSFLQVALETTMHSL